MIKRIVYLAAMTLALPTGLRAQQGFWESLFPRVHYFDPLIADPLEPRMGIGLMQTNVWELAVRGAERLQSFEFPDPDDSASDVNAAAAIGGSIPLLKLADWGEKGGIVASAQLGVFSRFRIEYPSRDDVGQDWFVGMPFEFRSDRWTGRFRIMHRSSHIGDELVETTGARRIEFGGEFADLLLGYSFFEGTRLYGGGTWNFRSYTERLPALQLRDMHDTFALQAGFDGTWYGWSDGRTGLVGGFDWQSAQRIGWRSQFSVAGGFAARTNGQGTKLLLRYFHGPSTLGEFFMTPETFWALEWVVDF
ncbi:MAG TPA: DUF1207 domain-containing protein [Longimicrobiales bacterium]